MQTIQFKVSESYLKNILDILHSFKDGAVKDISIVNKSNGNEVEQLHQLFAASDNKEKVNYQNTVDTRDMVDDIF